MPDPRSLLRSVLLLGALCSARCAPMGACPELGCREPLADAKGGDGPDAGVPAAPSIELCGNGLDDDRDLQADEECPCAVGATQACYVGGATEAGVGACVHGTQACVMTAEFAFWGACVGQGVKFDEVCDGVDNDCNGAADEGCGCRANETRPCYVGSPGTENIGACVGGIQTCRQAAVGAQTSWGSCENSVGPALEECDGYDNDCDGTVDEGCTCEPGDERPCYSGPAVTQNVGACRAGVVRCDSAPGAGSAYGACTGEVLPQAAETCGDGLDNDCNGDLDCADRTCAGATSCCMPGEEAFSIVLEPADVLFLVDRSGSMDDDIGSETRWDAMHSAMSAVLPAVEEILFTGLFVFPSDHAFATCNVASSPRVSIQLYGAAEVAAALADERPDGNTPTVQALLSARSYLRSRSSPRAQFIVLVTDGRPTCGHDASSAANTIRDLRMTDGIPTFVLGIHAPSETDNHEDLNLMAAAGGRPRSGSTQYYSADSPDALERALRGITAATAGCQYHLSRAASPDGTTTVYQDGIAVPANAVDGWSFTDSTEQTLRFNGSSCSNLTGGYVSEISVVFGC